MYMYMYMHVHVHIHMNMYMYVSKENCGDTPQFSLLIILTMQSFTYVHVRCT